MRSHTLRRNSSALPFCVEESLEQLTHTADLRTRQMNLCPRSIDLRDTNRAGAAHITVACRRHPDLSLTRCCLNPFRHFDTPLSTSRAGDPSPNHYPYRQGTG